MARTRAIEGQFFFSLSAAKWRHYSVLVGIKNVAGSRGRGQSEAETGNFSSWWSNETANLPVSKI